MDYSSASVAPVQDVGAPSGVYNILGAVNQGFQQGASNLGNLQKLRLGDIQNQGAQVDLENKQYDQPNVQRKSDLGLAQSDASLQTLPYETRNKVGDLNVARQGQYTSAVSNASNSVLQGMNGDNDIAGLQAGINKYWPQLQNDFPDYMPQGPVPQVTADNYGKVLAMVKGQAKAGLNTIGQQQHIAALQVPAAAEVASANVHAGATTKAAQTQADAEVRRAQIQQQWENKRTDQWIATKTNLQQKKQQVIAEMGKYANSHQPVPAGLLAQYRLLGSQEANEYMHWQMQTNPALMSEMDPKAYQAKVKNMRDAYKGMQEDTLRDALGSSYPGAPSGGAPAPQQQAPGGAGWSIVKH